MIHKSICYIRFRYPRTGIPILGKPWSPPISGSTSNFSSQGTLKPVLSVDGSCSDVELSYDRDTGIVWQTRAGSESKSLLPRRIRPLYQTIIGIEIHAQLAIPTKLFSSAPTSSASVNLHVHPFDLAYPGTLPSLSYSAVRAAVLSASALNCTVHKTSRFERKHYFYPDLPHGYQITQQRWPLGSGGFVEFESWTSPQQMKQKHGEQSKGGADEKKRRRGNKTRDGVANSNSNQLQSDKEFDVRKQKQDSVRLRIERVQLEQDTGKTTTHSMTSNHTKIYTSHIDYNRAGCALIEIVSHPDLRSAHEAAGAVETIRRLLRHVRSCDGRMENGSLRCDLNVSIAPIFDFFEDTDTLDYDVLRYLTEMGCNRPALPRDTGHRVEVKNLNSLRQIIAATEYEALRQSASSLCNNPTGRETRTFIVKPVSSEYPLGGETFCIRSKGDAVDYRFMPEPDLPPLVLDGTTLGYDDQVSSLEDYIRDIMPESLNDAAARLSKVYNLNDEVIRVITGDPPAIALLDESVDIARKELSILMSNDDEKSPFDDKIDSIPTLAANWLCNDLFALVKKSALEGKDGTSGTNDDELSITLIHPISVEYSTVDGKRLGSLIAMLVHGSITTSMAKKILSIMYKDDIVSTPQEIAKVNKYHVISDTKALVELCKSVVFHPKNASQLEQYKLGGKNVWKIEKYFVGKVMEQSGGNAHPEKMKEALSLVLTRI
ncbi:hypothetical protein ACHAW6_012544 [Cyclotella cf. meneghiniana]